jgi:hypothetical protein
MRRLLFASAMIAVLLWLYTPHLVVNAAGQDKQQSHAAQDDAALKKDLPVNPADYDAPTQYGSVRIVVTPTKQFRSAFDYRVISACNRYREPSKMAADPAKARRPDVIFDAPHALSRSLIA